MAEAVVEEYRSSLSELSFNSKPHINMLTMLAEENVQHADQIVETIVAHIDAVPPHMKLPGMYLVDSVIKNIGGLYIPLFGSHMTTLFTSVFEKVEENIRSQLYKLRLTWKEILPNNVLHHLDSQIRLIDPAWPVIATEPPKQIHVNPKFVGAPEIEESEIGKKTVKDQTADEREKNDMRKTQQEVIKELEEKKETLRKCHLALQEKIDKPKSINVGAPTIVQPSFVNTRDPRLKKAYATSGQIVPPVKSFVSHQLNTNSLQSVVVVPNARTLNVNGVETEDNTSVFHHPLISSNDEALGKVQNYKNSRKTQSSSPNGRKKIDDLSPKSKNTTFKRKQAEDADIGKNSYKYKAIQKQEQDCDKSTLLKSHCENSRQYDTRKLMSPPGDKEHKLQKISKKLMSLKSKLNYQRDILQRGGNQEFKNSNTKFDKRQPLTQAKKRGKELLLKYKNTEENEPARKKKKEISLKNQSHAQSAYLYGNDDKDYRSLKIKDPDDERSTFFHNERSSSHSPQYMPNFDSHKENDRENLHRGKYMYYIDRVMHSPYTVMRQAEEKYNSGRISKIVYQELCQNILEMMENEELYNCNAGMTLLQTDAYPNIQQKDFKYSMKEECNPERNTVSAKGVNQIPISSEPAVKSFKLDDKMRNIYFVDKKAFTLMNNNEPRELIFDGPPRNVHIEGITHPLRLGFNGHSAEFEIGGRIHTMQFGVPGREIYVNSVPFEASFGGPSFVALLGDGKLHRIQIDGPPPRVLTSQIPAFELYEKFRSLHSNIPLPQIENRNSNEKIDGLCDIDMRLRMSNITKPRLCFDHDPNTPKDIDWRHISQSEATQTVFELSKTYHGSYQTVEPELHPTENHLEINDGKSSSEFDSKLLRPSDAKAPAPLKPPPLGPFLNPELLSNSIQKPLLPPYSVPHATVAPSVSNNNAVFNNTSVPNVSLINAALTSLNSIAKSLPQVQVPTLTTVTAGSSIRPMYRNDGNIFPAVSTHSSATVPRQIPNQQWQPLLPPPPFLGSLPSSEHQEHNPHQSISLSVPTSQPPLLPNPVPTTSSAAPPSTDSTVTSVTPAPKMNVELFLEKLIAAGIIGKKKDEPIAAVTSDLNSSEISTEEVKDVEEEIIPVIEMVPKSLRKYHPVVINLLYKGSQCATCGMRFKEIQSEHYSRHLDWHFRTNRREKDGAKKPLSRRLFYEIKDWIDFKEFEDFEERAPSYFELQASGEQMKESEKENIISVPSVRCETEICSVCGEQFQLFWVEEEEEWHLKHAVRHNDQVYHPACYEDFCKASEKPSSSENELDDSVVVVEEPESNVKVESNSETEVKMDVELNSETEVKMDVESNSETEVKMDVESNSTTDDQDSATLNSSVKDERDTLDSKPAVDNATSETVITVKMEPDDAVSIEQSCSKEETSPLIVKSEPSETSTATPVEEVTNINDESTKEEKTSEAQSESSQTATEITVKEESDDEVEFRPPTPDPNFENLPPVLRGTELSALCCIM